MTPLEIALLATGILTLAAIVTIWLLQSHGSGSAKLPVSMLLVLRITLGIIFIILGIIGGFVPIMQGWIFMLLAVLVLFPRSKFAIKSLDKIEKKAPRVVAWLRRLGIGSHQ